MRPRPACCPRCHHRIAWWQWRQQPRRDGSVQWLCAPCARASTARDIAMASIRDRLRK